MRKFTSTQKEMFGLVNLNKNALQQRVKNIGGFRLNLKAYSSL